MQQREYKTVEVFFGEFESADHATDKKASTENISGANQGTVDSSDRFSDCQHRAHNAQPDAKLRETVVLLAAAGLGAWRPVARCDCLSATKSAIVTDRRNSIFTS